MIKTTNPIRNVLKKALPAAPANGTKAVDAHGEYRSLLTDISRIYEDAKDSTLIAVNKIRNRAYWMIGRRIVEVEQKGEVRAQYGTRLIENISRDLGLKYANGFSESQLRAMRKFFLTHPNQQPAAELSWSHYQMLLKVKDDHARQDLERRAAQYGWSKRDLRRIMRNLEEDPEVAGALAGPAGDRASSLPLHRGKPFVYRIARLAFLNGTAGPLVVDCGFNIFTDLPPEQGGSLKEGDLIRSVLDRRKEIRLDQPAVDRRELYTFRALLERVIDGDTLLVNVDCGFGMWTRQRLRLKSIDCPPLASRRGARARDFVEEALAPCEFIAVKTYRSDKYDRYLTDVFFLPGSDDLQTVAAEGRFLNQELVDKNLAVVQP